MLKCIVLHKLIIYIETYASSYAFVGSDFLIPISIFRNGNAKNQSRSCVCTLVVSFELSHVDRELEYPVSR